MNDSGLLVCAKPVIKALHGLGIEIDAIDPEYTLGDMEGRKLDIRARLHRDCVIQRQLRLNAALGLCRRSGGCAAGRCRAW